MPAEDLSAEILQRYRDGDERAADELFSRYVGRLTLLARSRLSPALASRTDPEDVVLSAYRSFFIRARDGRFALRRSGDLWRLLVAITLHKLYRQARKHKAERRALAARESQAPSGERLHLSREPSPEEAVALADELETLFSQLDAVSRRVVELRLQDREISEIAAEVGRTERTVRRALAAVRKRLCSQNPDLRREFERINRESQSEVGNDQTPMERSEPKRWPAEQPVAVPDSLAPLAYGDYLLEEMIGAGRFGRVYRARQRSLGRQVAVKYLRKSFQQDPDAVARFFEEAHTVSRLQHPGIVPIHGVGKTPSGGYFIVMDLVDGCDLSRRIRQGEIPIAHAVRWAIEACDALAHAHERGVMHCDLKPANLLLNEQGGVRVTDFGLARSIHECPRPVERIEGTCAFMAPEQVSGWWGSISPRTDVYGVGAVLFNLLTGEPPYRGASLADVLAQVVSGVATRSPNDLRPDVPTRLNDICVRCLAKSPDARFSSMRDLGGALSESPPTIE
jgi:DNA-directed RNA polymerase specialized sigma24 family protein